MKLLIARILFWASIIGATANSLILVLALIFVGLHPIIICYLLIWCFGVMNIYILNDYINITKVK